MTGNGQTLYPLRFNEVLRNYAFGNRWIVESFAKPDLPEDHRIAETWEVVDRPGESSVVNNGPLAGRTLSEIIAGYGEAFLGRDVVARGGMRFPLLIKFLDASNPLGEQIHPSDEAAAAMGSADPGKTEAWYMLRVRPGATIHCANVPGLDRETLVQALMRGESRNCMDEREVSPGEAFLLYAGTMHYSAGGVLFYEIMQNSDVTIGLNRMVNEGLEGEALAQRAGQVADMIHLEEGFEPRTTQVTVEHGRNRQTYTMACRYFGLERWDLAETWLVDMDGEQFWVLSVIEGQADVVHGDMRETLLAGQSCLLPANLGEVRIEPAGEASVLKAYLPNLEKDVIEPLRARGVSDEEILGLGGRTRLSDLGPLL
jgi:mannose-6-phosphate isomerase